MAVRQDRTFFEADDERPLGFDENADADTICVVSIARRVCGAEVAAKLSQAFGGTRVHIPARIGPRHQLARAIGLEAAEKIAAECFGTSSYVALNPRDSAQRRQALVQLLLAEGKTRAEIALAARCSERVVYRDIALLRERGAIIPRLSSGPIQKPQSKGKTNGRHLD